MKQLTDDDKMPFGKYKGVVMADVPATYLHWLWTEGGMKNKVKTSDVAQYIAENIDALRQEHKDGIWS